MRFGVGVLALLALSGCAKKAASMERWWDDGRVVVEIRVGPDLRVTADRGRGWEAERAPLPVDSFREMWGVDELLHIRGRVPFGRARNELDKDGAGHGNPLWFAMCTQDGSDHLVVELTMPADADGTKEPLVCAAGGIEVVANVIVDRPSGSR